jgi:hypothetical protein
LAVSLARSSASTPGTDDLERDISGLLSGHRFLGPYGNHRDGVISMDQAHVPALPRKPAAKGCVHHAS